MFGYEAISKLGRTPKRKAARSNRAGRAKLEPEGYYLLASSFKSDCKICLIVSTIFEQDGGRIMDLTMKIQNIKNINELEIRFPLDKGLYAITGENGAGKSPLISVASSVFYLLPMYHFFGRP